MKIKILEIKTAKLVFGIIRKGNASELPSLQDNWCFNFKKQLEKSYRRAFVLVSEQTPDIIEGCLIFEMKNKEIPINRKAYIPDLDLRFYRER
jgi:hypothetical protein